MLSIKGVELLRGGGGGGTSVLARNKGFNRRSLLSEFVVAGAVALLLLSCLVHSRQLNDLSESKVSDICSDFTPYVDKGSCMVDRNGVRSEACITCFVEEEWGVLKEALGTGRVSGRRAFEPHIVMGPDSSHQLQSTMLRIIIEELLGYQVSVSRGNSRWTRHDEVATGRGCRAFNMEVWPGDSREEAELVGEGLISRASTGSEVSEGLFVPNYLPLVARHWEGLRSNIMSQETPEGPLIGSLDGFLHDGATTQPESLTSLGLEGPDWGCHSISVDWNQSECVQGRWYPPACGDAFPSPDCFESYFPGVIWTPGWYEAVIKNLGLNFSVAYVGESGLSQIVEDQYINKEHFLYHWYEPHPLLLKYPSARVSFPECAGNVVDSWALDPMDSGINCTTPSRVLDKWANPQVLASEPDLAHLFERWKLSTGQVTRLLSLLSDAGGPHGSVETAACAFLKDPNSDVDWRSWVRISTACVGDEAGWVWDDDSQTCVHPDSDTHQLMRALLIAAVCVSAALVAVLMVLWLRHHALRRYVRVMEEANLSELDDVEFDTPINQAIAVLQEVGRAGSTPPRVVQQRAVAAWHNLLAAEDVNMPMPKVGSDETRSTEEVEKELADIRLMKRFIGTSSTAWDNNEAASETASHRCSADAIILDSTDSVTAGAGDLLMQVDVTLRCCLSSHPLHSIGSSFQLDWFSLADECEGRPLVYAGLLSLRKFNLVKSLNLNERKLVAFLAAVESGYRDVPYHNKAHAADVVARLTAILQAEELLRDDENICYTVAMKCVVLSAILAAVIHDYDHPGMDNNYHVMSETELSQRFNQQMVLENNSLYHCLALLRRPELNFMSGMRKRNRDNVQSLVIQMVLATDMSGHFSVVGDFGAKVVEPYKEKRRQDPTMTPSKYLLTMDEKTRTLTMCMAIKVADIGHSFLPFETHRKWCSALEEEFFRQGRAEAEKGLKPGMLKDPSKPGVMDPGNAQAFFNVLAIPTAKAWGAVFEASGGELLRHGRSNRDAWKEMTGDAPDEKSLRD